MPLPRKFLGLRRLSTALDIKLLKLKEIFKTKEWKKTRTERTNAKLDSLQDNASSQPVTLHPQIVTSEPSQASKLPPITSDSVPEAPERVFTLFRELPTEIRLLIWELSLPGPRIVPLKQRALDTVPFVQAGLVSSNWPTSSIEPSDDVVDEEPTDRNSWIPLSTLSHTDQKELDYPWRTNLSNLSGFHSTVSPPTILYVCHESYEVASKFYTRAFGSYCALPSTWFDYKNDTLLFTMTADTGFYLYDASKDNFLEDALPRIFSEERSLVQNIAVDFKFADEDNYVAYMWLGWIIVLFPNVRNFTYELPTTATTAYLRNHGNGAELRMKAFEEAFMDYRANGTIKYDITSWQEYLEKEHGCKDLKVTEKCISGSLDLLKNEATRTS